MFVGTSVRYVFSNLSMADYYRDGHGDYYLLNFDALFHSYGLWARFRGWCTVLSVQ